MIWAYFLAGFACLMTAVHFASIGLAWKRCKSRREGAALPVGVPPVTILRPLCGIDPFDSLTLDSSFVLAYPDYELVFCVADPGDPVIQMVTRQMAAHPQIPARLILGDVAISDNPKLNNLVKGWDSTSRDWIVMADSNVLMPRDCIQRLMERWDAKTGLVCSTPVGARPEGFAAELECAFLNTYQARWQYASERVGGGFAQGKTMLWRRDILEAAGGIRALASDIAEDAAATKLVHAQGLHVRLVAGPFQQPLGRRSLGQVWHRQLRWARLRRATFPLFFVPEFLAGWFWPALAAAFAAHLSGRNGFGTALAFIGLWLTAEALLARAAGWRLAWASLAAMLVRDALLPVLWLWAWFGNDFVWRGHAMSVSQPRAADG